MWKLFRKNRRFRQGSGTKMNIVEKLKKPVIGFYIGGTIGCIYILIRQGEQFMLPLLMVTGLLIGTAMTLQDAKDADGEQK